jgi:hypothetical protein
MTPATLPQKKMVVQPYKLKQSVAQPTKFEQSRKKRLRASPAAALK